MSETKRFTPGMTVFVVLRDDSEEPIEAAKYVYLACVEGVVLAAAAINGHLDLNRVLGYLLSCTRDDEALEMVAVPVEDCYTSKKAAKEAIANELDC